MTMQDAITRRIVDGKELWDFKCPYPTGCGPFSSADWPNRQHAVDRGMEHLREHAGEGAMTDLNSFRQARGIIPNQPPTPAEAMKALE